MRDLYDLHTKIRALNSELQEEEMRETHTPFASQELVDLVYDAGFEVADITSLTPMDRHREYYGMTLESAVKPSNRHIVLQGNKCE